MTAEVDYTAVQEFVALILSHRWEARSLHPYEYLRLSMVPELESHLPEGIELDHVYGYDEGGMIDARLKRPKGWSL